MFLRPTNEEAFAEEANFASATNVSGAADGEIFAFATKFPHLQAPLDRVKYTSVHLDREWVKVFRT